MQCTLKEVFVAEAIAWHLLLSDTDVAPTILFEVKKLVNLCNLMYEGLEFGESGCWSAQISSGHQTAWPFSLSQKVVLRQLVVQNSNRWTRLNKPREDLQALAALMPPVTIPAMQNAMMRAFHAQMFAL